MLTAVFGFRGRINRRQYFLGNIAVGAVLALLAGLFIGFIELAPTPQPTFAMSLDAVLLVVVAPLAVWSALSLQARRLRDIGLEPLVVIPMWIGVLGLAQSQLIIALSCSLAVLACLYGWPGRRGGHAPISDGGRVMAFSPVTVPASRRLVSSGRRRR